MGVGSTILYIEDEESDAVLLEYAFEKAGVTDVLRVAWGGQEGIDYLLGKDKFFDRETYPMPRLVLLDLKMPAVDGFDVLRLIRAQPSLRSLKVLIFSSSNHPADVKNAYILGADSYLVKPLGLEHWVETVKEIKAKFLA